MFVVFVCMYRSSVTAVHVERHCKSVKLIVRYTVATEKPLAFSVCAAIGQVRLPSTRPAGRFFTFPVFWHCILFHHSFVDTLFFNTLRARWAGFPCMRDWL